MVVWESNLVFCRHVFDPTAAGLRYHFSSKSRPVQVKTIVSLLLRRFEIEPLDPLPEPNYKVMVVRTHGFEGEVKW